MHPKTILFLSTCTLLLLVLCHPLTAETDDSAPYRILKEFKLGGNGGWDLLALDSESHKLYVSRSTRVMVVDANEGKLLGEISDLTGVHGVALAPEFGTGFISCGKLNAVKVFDLAKNSVTETIPVGMNPDAILYDSATKNVFCFNHSGQDVTVIDVKTLKVIKTIPLNGQPELAATDANGKVFVNLENTSEVIIINAKELAVTGRIPLAPGKEPTGLGIDTINHRLFSACANHLMVITDYQTAKVLGTAPIGGGPDGAGFDETNGFAFSSNRDGTLSVIKEATPGNFIVVQALITQPSARTMVLDPKTHEIFLPAAQLDKTQPSTNENPHPKPALVPESFKLIVAGPSK